MIPQSNILVDASGNVLLTDYGLAPINQSVKFMEDGPLSENARWLAPEIVMLPPGSAMESKPADVHSFAMLGVEVFTGEAPFADLSVALAVKRVSEGDRPELPQSARDV